MSDEPKDLEQTLRRIESALDGLPSQRARPGQLAAGQPAAAFEGSFEAGSAAGALGWRAPAATLATLVLLGAGFTAAVATGHGEWGFAGAFASWVTFMSSAGWLARKLRAPRQRARPHIGMGASIGRDAVVEPGATVEMGASVGAGAVIKSGAVVRMGASIGARAVLESDAVVSWGADVRKDAVVGAGARIGSGATVRSGAHVPAGTHIHPGGEWGGKKSREAAKEARRDQLLRGETSLQRADKQDEPEERAAAPGAGERAISPKEAAAPLDPRVARFNAVFERIDAQLALAPTLLREHLGPSAGGVRALRATCDSLLSREQSLRVEASPEALAQLDAEKKGLEARIASTDDAQIRSSLERAVAAIAEQQRQRQLLSRSADRLDAELTRLFWTLDGLAAQLLRLRSAGADAAQAPDAALTQSVLQLQTEIEAIADALEQVAQDDRAVAPANPAAPVLAERALAPPQEGDAQSASREAPRVKE